MRKFLSIFLILTMLLSFAGCSQEIVEDTEPAPTIENTETTEQTEIIEDDPIPTTEPPTEPETEPIVTEPPEFDITMSFTGDMMLAAYEGHSYKSSFTYYADTQEPSYFLEKVKHIFEDDDFTVGNLENVLTDRSLNKRDKGSGRAFWFKAPTAYTEILTCSSFEGVSLANNHTYDFKQAGYDDTIEAVKNAGLNYGSEEKIMYFEKEGFVIAIICNGLWYEEQADDIIDRIKEAEENSHFQIVFYHGGTEKAHAPENWRVRASRKLVDNGADLVLGNHPHV
jgi:poly-gamma-glutamate synthesis protein (capsule biosynthesis protein)